MKNRLLLFLIASLAIVVLSGCGAKPITVSGEPSSDNGSNVGQKVSKGDVGNNICQYFNADFVYSATGKPVVKVEPDWILPEQACRYYFTYDANANSQYDDPRLRGGGQLIFMMVENLSVENQKKGLDVLGGTYKSEARIKMENMLTYREGGSLRDIRLIINPNRYVRMDTNSGGKGITEEELIQFAIKVAEMIQGKSALEIKKNPIELAEDKPTNRFRRQPASGD